MDFKEGYDDTCSTVGKACWTGNVDALKGLIAAGRPVDVKDNRGWFPLHAAAYRQGQPECLEILLQDEDCDVNWKTFEGETALYLASKICNIDAIKLLLRRGADVNLTTNEKLSPLWEATVAEENHLACVLVLVAAGANVNQQTYTGDTPLHAAAELGNTETVTFLLDKGADMNVQTDDGLTPVFIASQFAQHECLKIMLEMADQKPDGYAKHLVDAMATDNATPLLIAAQAGSAECVKLLLDRGANPDIACQVESETGYLLTETPLLVAAQVGSVECVKLLLDRGANPDIACEVECTTSYLQVPYVPLQMAVHKQHPSCVELLAPVTTEVKMDCDVLGCNHPVCLAIKHDNICCIKILLDNGYSWKKIYKEIISYVHGANISMNGETEFCYLYFFEDMSFNVVHYFLRLGIMKPSLNTRIKTTRSAEKFLLLLKYGANPTVLDSNGVNQVAVHIIRFCNVDLMYALIKYGTKLQFGNEQCWHSGIFHDTDRNILALVVLCLCSNIPTDEEVRTKKLESGVEKIREASWGLRHACRVKIVRQLISRGKYTTDSVNSLGLPTILKYYLLYKEFDDDFYYGTCRLNSLGTEMREAFRKLEVVDSTVEMLMAANKKEF